MRAVAGTAVAAAALVLLLALAVPAAVCAGPVEEEAPDAAALALRPLPLEPLNRRSAVVVAAPRVGGSAMRFVETRRAGVGKGRGGGGGGAKKGGGGGGAKKGGGGGAKKGGGGGKRKGGVCCRICDACAECVRLITRCPVSGGAKRKAGGKRKGDPIAEASHCAPYLMLSTPQYTRHAHDLSVTFHAGAKRKGKGAKRKGSFDLSRVSARVSQCAQTPMQVPSARVQNAKVCTRSFTLFFWCRSLAD